MFADKAVQGLTSLPALPPDTWLWRLKAPTLPASHVFLSPQMLRACAPLHHARLQMGGCEVGWSKLLWPGPVPGCSHPRGGSRGGWREQSLGRGCSQSEHEHFSKPHCTGPGECSFALAWVR